MKKIAGLILKELLVQIILSTVLVVILAFIVFELSLGDGIIRIMILAIYGICSLVGGLILEKIYKKESFCGGLLREQFI
ncbi:MAG: TIGR04086 family membrane protein [Eubacterium ventriosum]